MWTKLVQSGNIFNLNPVAGGTGPTIKLSGSGFHRRSQAGSYVPIGAEKTASGYDVAWKNTSTGQYAIWTTDNNGNYTGLAFGVVSGTDTNLKSIETVFRRTSTAMAQSGFRLRLEPQLNHSV